jgi:hypothetical protein
MLMLGMLLRAGSAAVGAAALAPTLADAPQAGDNQKQADLGRSRS